MKFKEISIITFLLVFLMQFTSAIATPVSVQTFPNYDVMVSALRPGYVYNLIGDSFQGVSNANGTFSITLSTNDSDDIDVKVWVKKDNVPIVIKRFEGYNVGVPINLEVYPDNYVKPTPVVNVSENTTKTDSVPVNETNDKTPDSTNTSNTSAENSGSKLTGAAVDDGKSSSNTLYYLLGGAVLLALAGFVASTLLKRREGIVPKEVRVRKLSDIRKENSELSAKSAEEYKRAYEATEKKLEESQREITKLRNQEKIKQVEDRILREKEELRKLRKGY
ncbi:MAG TPA: hypothetical protein VJH92_00230 [Candidatus Nanoarchaeia archaeon]|nr:hypothetical protein [Candidatus Nanoarchaeia archaeon]